MLEECRRAHEQEFGTRDGLVAVLQLTHSGRYTFAITRVLQLAGLITVMTVGGTIALALRRDRRQ